MCELLAAHSNAQVPQWLPLLATPSLLTIGIALGQDHSLLAGPPNWSPGASAKPGNWSP